MHAAAVGWLGMEQSSARDLRRGLPWCGEAKGAAMDATKMLMGCCGVGCTHEGGCPVGCGSVGAMGRWMLCVGDDGCAMRIGKRMINKRD